MTPLCPFPCLGLSFLGYKKGPGARKLCLCKQVLLFRSEEVAQPQGGGGREGREGLPGGEEGATRRGKGTG